MARNCSSSSSWNCSKIHEMIYVQLIDWILLLKRFSSEMHETGYFQNEILMIKSLWKSGVNHRKWSPSSLISWNMQEGWVEWVSEWGFRIRVGTPVEFRWSSVHFKIKNSIVFLMYTTPQLLELRWILYVSKKVYIDQT